MCEKVITYYYSAHSAYAYLGAAELQRIANAAGWRIDHRPFDFLPVVAAAGGLPVAQRSPAHIAYFFGRELIRWAEWRDLPILRHRPTYHDNSLAPASGMILAAPNPCALSAAILHAHWVADADIANQSTLVTIADALDLDGQALYDEGQTVKIQAQFAANTDAAIARDVLGSPTYVVGGDMFYGQDRLQMVARALHTPFAD